MKPVKRIVLISALAATIFAAQIGLAFIPNVELVTLLFLLVAQFVVIDGKHARPHGKRHAGDHDPGETVAGLHANPP